MAVTMPRERWTDERLDHFEKRVDERFDNFERRVDEQFKQVDKRLDLRQAVDRLSESMRKNFIALAMLVVAAVVFF
jgi:hypothetical protein